MITPVAVFMIQSDQFSTTATDYHIDCSNCTMSCFPNSGCVSRHTYVQIVYSTSRSTLRDARKRHDLIDKEIVRFSMSKPVFKESKSKIKDQFFPSVKLNRRLMVGNRRK